MPDEAEAQNREKLERVSDDEVHSVAGVGPIEMPEPNGNAIAAANAGADATAPASSSAPPSEAGPVDRHGRAFDPAIHECDEAKAPILGRNGKLKIRRGGDMRSYVASPRGAPAAEGAAASSSAPPIGDPAAPAPPDYRKVAETWMNPALDTVTGILGAEWQFDSSRRDRYVACAERIAMKRSINVEMAPELELVFLLWGDFVARIELPETKKRYESAKKGISAWWSRLWSRLRGRAPREPELEDEPTAPPTSSDGDVSEGGRPLKEAERAPLQFPPRDPSPREAPLSTEPLPLP